MAGIPLCINQVSINNDEVEHVDKFKCQDETIIHNLSEKINWDRYEERTK